LNVIAKSSSFEYPVNLQNDLFTFSNLNSLFTKTTPNCPSSNILRNRSSLSLSSSTFCWSFLSDVIRSSLVAISSSLAASISSTVAFNSSFTASSSSFLVLISSSALLRSVVSIRNPSRPTTSPPRRTGLIENVCQAMEPSLHRRVNSPCVTSSPASSRSTFSSASA